MQGARAAAAPEHEACFVQGLQMAARGRLGHAERSGDLADAKLLVTQHAEDANADRIGKDRKIPHPLLQRAFLARHDQRPGGSAVVPLIGTPRTLSCSTAIMFCGFRPYAWRKRRTASSDFWMRASSMPAWT